MNIRTNWARWSLSVCSLVLLVVAMGCDSESGGDGAEEADTVGSVDTPPVQEDVGGAIADVRVNEVMAKAAEDAPDWVELYNAGADVADVSGWEIRDDNDAHSLILPEGTTIAPGGFLVLSGEGGDGIVFDFGFGSDDAVRLFDGAGVLVDTADWDDGDAVEGTTWGRYPDGEGDFQTLSTPTMGAANTAM